ncbi:uncharacterized protein LOC122225969 [Panthera leo]|uniref:uncharacterized protein LOC122225969 n=1 Tax=Panthera leo TaxID=9689 RepID=UPI001C6A022F|nr:uncharacterized protein LOC122225969 [Panthera leo]
MFEVPQLHTGLCGAQREGEVQTWVITLDGADTASSRRQEVGGPSGWSWRTDRRSHPGKFSGFLDISTGQALGDWGIWREHTGLRRSLDSSSRSACLGFRILGQQPPPEPWPHPEPAWLPRLQPTTTVTGVGAVAPASMAPMVVQAAAAPELGPQPPPETGAQLGGRGLGGLSTLPLSQPREVTAGVQLQQVQGFPKEERRQ